MTGKQIAANLRKSRRKWGKRSFYNPDFQTYCVLGIKAAEKGVSVKVLRWNEDGDDTVSYDDFNELSELVSMNDSSNTKEQLISRLESTDYAKVRFDVEGFVRHLKTAQRKRLHLRIEE